VYRRFYEWLPSIYFELHKPKTLHRSTEVETYPSLVQWLSKDNIAYYKYLYTVADRFSAVFDDVVVLDLYGDTDIVSSFYCSALSDATESCKNKGMKGDARIARTSIDQNLDYQRLVNIAVARGILRTNLNIHQIAGKVAELSQYLEMRKDCLSAEISDIIWEITLDAERKQYPQRYENQYSESVLRTSFVELVNTKLCSFRVDEILADPKWLDLLSSM